MAKKKIPLETAQAEVQSWLDYKKVSDQKQKNLKENTDIMAHAIVDGRLVLRAEDMHFVHALSFAVKNASGKETVSELVYKPRLTVKDVNDRMKGVKPADGDARIVRLVGAITGQPSAVLENLDTEDNSLAQQFASFFL